MNMIKDSICHDSVIMIFPKIESKYKIQQIVSWLFQLSFVLLVLLNLIGLKNGYILRSIKFFEQELKTVFFHIVLK